MLMVVFFHSLCFYTHNWSYNEIYAPVWQFIGSMLNYIDMPAFVFISGYLYAYLKLERGKYSDNTVFLKGKAKRLMLPYCVWTAVNVALVPSTLGAEKILKGYSHLWFLMMLMMVFVIVTLTQRWWKRFSLRQFLFFIGTSIGIYYVLKLLHMDFRWFGVEQAAHFLPYFLLGMMIVKFRILERLRGISKSCKIVYILLAITALAIISWTDASQWTLKGLFYINTACVYVAVSLLLITVFDGLSFTPPLQKSTDLQIHRSLLYKILISLDSCSMGIYIIHHIIIIYLLQYQWMRTLMVEYYIAMPILLFALLLATSWSMTIVLNKTRLKSMI